MKSLNFHNEIETTYTLSINTYMPLPGPRKPLPRRPVVGPLVNIYPPGQMPCLYVPLKFMNISK